MAFKVKVLLELGSLPDKHYETVEFATEAEARAFIRGCDLASEAIDGCYAGSVDARLIDQPGPEAGWCVEHEKDHFLHADGACYEN